MTPLRRILLLVAFLSAGTVAFAQRPGDKVEYKAQRWPEKWDVGVFVKVLPGGTQVLIREAPTTYFPEGFERAYALNDVRPHRNAVAAPVAPPPPPIPPRVSAPVYTPAPAPVPTPAPAPALPAATFAACGPRPDPVSNRADCVHQVAERSANWRSCEGGDEAACHRFVREVGQALAAGDPRWGLITKPRGQHSCDAQHCGPDVGGFGGDVIAYLPDGHTPQQWLGADIIGGAGARGARPQWMAYEGYTTNRPDNLWISLPR